MDPLYGIKKGTNPQPNRDQHLEEYINCLKQTANTNSVDTHVKSNLRKAQQKTIKNLQNDESIIIKEADKGGGIGILDNDHYKEMVLNQLEDGVFYEKLNGIRDKSTMSKIRKLIKEYSNNLTNNEVDSLKNVEVKTSNFYGLPKIHKSKEIQDHIENRDSMYIKINRPTDLKLKPIIAGPSCSTQRLSNLLDILLKPLCIKVPSFVRDDIDFLNYIPDRVPLDTILELKNYLKRQNYPVSLIDNGIKSALSIPIVELRKTVPRDDKKDKQQPIPFVITHNPRNHKIFNSAKGFLSILHQSKKMKDLVDESQLIGSRRQVPNLKKLLTRAKVSTQKVAEVQKCGDPRCGTCKMIEVGQSKTLKSGTVNKPNRSMNCKSENIIYSATSPTCNKNYIIRSNQ
ncbi:unnamed protein product [Mytilus coruscus]|uniref:Reverse transcriptase domain-containing protein n=1 Tax=Mytilus coruscus TaxID=42192 RepID=A0A6J8BG35_MYTCO|nr:unnamed protein product [Mytilus coruscus]